MESSRNAEQQYVIPGSIEQLSGLAHSSWFCRKSHLLRVGAPGGGGEGGGPLVGGSVLSPLWVDGFCSWMVPEHKTLKVLEKVTFFIEAGVRGVQPCVSLGGYE